MQNDYRPKLMTLLSVVAAVGLPPCRPPEPQSRRGKVPHWEVGHRKWRAWSADDTRAFMKRIERRRRKAGRLQAAKRIKERLDA